MQVSRFGKNSVLLLTGALSMLAIFLLTGAVTQAPPGKYEMEVVVRDRSTQIYVLDTTTGAVKWVDAMNTPFEQMKGD
ncbi:hypothetical protein [Desulfogranum marinum]|uniref:hypothetical protein n=1 Tax=Desulfogranum marinum TaxID=453220 RepID=UPI001963252E|nr:hypothetical protein [Desulfogranum marinum]MBM9513060.1 hypothetical protein [Desulfogranum marinum]